MPEPRRLIVGLGNPGPTYEHTRHNIGFAVVDQLAGDLNVTLKGGRGNALLAWGRLDGRSVGLAKPLTFMNRSGQAVQQLIRYYNIDLPNVLVVTDDLNLAPGVIRIRPQGSAGGHNGVQDIIDSLGSNDFPRLRIGIGNNYYRGKQADFVLSRFSREEQPLVEEAVVRARDAALTFIREGVVTAMNRYNG